MNGEEIVTFSIINQLKAFCTNQNNSCKKKNSQGKEGTARCMKTVPENDETLKLNDGKSDICKMEISLFSKTIFTFGNKAKITENFNV